MAQKLRSILLCTPPKTSVRNLPDEILGKIFSYLPLGDRKNVRLSCYRFYEACNQVSIQKEEEIVFSGNYSSDKAILLLSETERKVWNLKLNGGCFNKPCIMEFFKKRGAQIHSLHINSCEFSPTLLNDMIKCCPNLKSAHFVYNSNIHMEYYQNFLADFIALHEEGFVCPNVTSLTLKLPQSWELHRSLTNAHILAFFAVFPRVRNLALNVEIDEYFDAFPSNCPVIPEARLVFPCVFECIQNVSHQLEKLSVHFEYLLGRSYASIEMLNRICSLKMRRLKELSLNWIDQWDPICNPFVQFQRLTHFSCVVGEEIDQAVSHSCFLQLLLSTATQLKTLKVRTRSGFSMNADCFRALVTSQLSSLAFHAPKDIDGSPVDSVIANFHPWPTVGELEPNYTLRKLRMMSNCHVLLLFSTHFRRLESLKVKEVGSDVLKDIFKLNVRKLNLLCHITVTYQVLSLRLWLLQNEHQLSHRPFNNLTYLHILEDNELELSTLLFTKFKFPKLKSLFLETKDKLKIGHCNIRLWRYLQTLSELESLEIRWSNRTAFEQWVALFGALPKLRHFIIAESYSRPFPNHEYLELFRLNPSLRSIDILKNRTWGSYYMDMVSNTVVAKVRKNAVPLDHPLTVDGIPHCYEVTQENSD